MKIDTENALIVYDDDISLEMREDIEAAGERRRRRE
jgi:hypothetical protein